MFLSLINHRMDGWVLSQVRERIRPGAGHKAGLAHPGSFSWWRGGLGLWGGASKTGQLIFVSLLEHFSVGRDLVSRNIGLRPDFRSRSHQFVSCGKAINFSISIGFCCRMRRGENSFQPNPRGVGGARQSRRESLRGCREAGRHTDP